MRLPDFTFNGKRKGGAKYAPALQCKWDFQARPV